jgi:Helix-turn-helix domain
MPDTFTIEPNGVYGNDDVCTMLDVSPQTLAGARRTGALRAARKGRRWLYLGEWLLEWLRQPEGPTDD